MHRLPFHCSLSTVSRAGGQIAPRKGAYNAGVLLTNSKTGEKFDFRSKRGVVDACIVYDAEDSPSIDRQALWDQAERRERQWNSRLAREFKLSLPAMLSDAAKLSLLKRFALFISRKLQTPVDLAFHRASKNGDSRNDHGHLLFPTRTMINGRLAKKHRQLDNPRSSGRIVEELRKTFADYTNEAIKQAGIEGYYVDHRSYQRQGLDKQSGVHLGPKRWWQLKRIRAELHALDQEETKIREDQDKMLSEKKVEEAQAELLQWIDFARGERDAPGPGAFLLQGHRLAYSESFCQKLARTQASLGEKAAGNQFAGGDELLRDLLREFQLLAEASFELFERSKEKRRKRGIDR